MSIPEPAPRDDLWASLLCGSGTPVLRVPELRPALRWWRSAVRARVLLRGRLGDLRIVVADLEALGGMLVVIVGGPGAIESVCSAPADDLRGHEPAIADPWGNTLMVRRNEIAMGVSA